MSAPSAQKTLSHGILQALGQPRSGTGQPGHYCSPRHARNLRYLLVGQLFHLAQYDNFPKIGWKLLHTAFHGPRALLRKGLGLGRSSAARVKFLAILGVAGARAVIAQP